MNPKRRKRLLIVLLLVLGSGAAVGFGAYAMRHSIDVFVTPSDVEAGKVPEEQRISVGGLVVEGSLKRLEGVKLEFQVTDTKGVVTIRHEGILPDLFREGKGIMVKGVMGGNRIVEADTVLAKHDENYMPPEALEAIQAAGHPAGAGYPKGTGDTYGAGAKSSY
jgi:cytochrome c-type biogenesis protein CcmE